MISHFSLCVPGDTSQPFSQFPSTRFLTQPEVKFHVFKRLKRGEGKSLREKFFSLYISEPQVECNKKIKKKSVIGTLSTQEKGMGS